MDELKKYLQQHREQLDTDEPSPAIWGRIEEAQAPPAKPVRSLVVRITTWAVAACLLALAGIGVRSLMLTREQPLPPTLAATTTKVPPVVVTDTKPLNSDVQVEQPTQEVAAVVPIIKKNTPAKAPVSMLAAADRRMLNEIDNSFTQVINLQRGKVSSTPMYAESAEYFRDFTVEMKDLEKEEKKVKARIVQYGLSDNLLEQLINLYQQKLNTLKSLQLEMNKLNNRYKQVRNPVDSVKTYFIHI
jgi:hypothetical protein